MPADSSLNLNDYLADDSNNLMGEKFVIFNLTGDSLTVWVNIFENLSDFFLAEDIYLDVVNLLLRMLCSYF